GPSVRGKEDPATVRGPHRSNLVSLPENESRPDAVRRVIDPDVAGVVGGVVDLDRDPFPVRREAMVAQRRGLADETACPARTIERDEAGGRRGYRGGDEEAGVGDGEVRVALPVRRLDPGHDRDRLSLRLEARSVEGVSEKRPLADIEEVAGGVGGIGEL